MINLPPELIIDFIENNFEFKWNSSHTEIRINSPFCNDRKFHLYINVNKGKYCDYKSGSQGNFLSFVKEFYGFSDNREAEDHLIKNYYNGTLEELFNNSTKSPNKAQILQATLDIPKNLKFFYKDELSFIGKKALSYVLKRGFSEDKIKMYNLGYCFDGDYADRIFIPFFENRKLVYFIARDFNNGKLRYKNPSGVNSKDYVFNYDNLQETIGIVEGVFDAMTLDYPVTTATLSAEISDNQVKKILEKKLKNIIWIPDTDETGQRTLYKNWKKFISLQPITSEINHFVYEIKGAKDMNELGKKVILLDECKKLSESYFLKI